MPIVLFSDPNLLFSNKESIFVLQEKKMYRHSMKRLLFGIYFWSIAMPIFAVVTIILALMVHVGCLLGGRKIFAYYPGLIWSRIALALTFCRIEVEGKENYNPKDGPFVVMANHQGSYDIFMMYGYLAIKFVWIMKQSLRKVPFMGKACETAGFIFINQTSISSIRESLLLARTALIDGFSVFLFPEGSRTLNGKMGKSHKGGFLVAQELNIPIIPVSISGSYKVLKRGHYTPYPHKLKLVIHPVVSPASFAESSRPIEEMRDHVSQIIESGIEF